MYACLYILEIWNVKLYDYPELILIFYRLVTFKNLLNTLPSQYRISFANSYCSKVMLKTIKWMYSEWRIFDWWSQSLNCFVWLTQLVRFQRLQWHLDISALPKYLLTYLLVKKGWSRCFLPCSRCRKRTHYTDNASVFGSFGFIYL